MRWICLASSILLAAISAGCGSTAQKNKVADGAGKSEAEIKQAFSALQAAIKAADAEKIWTLLAKDSQADAEREAKAVQQAYGKLDESAKSPYEKKIGLSPKEMTDMTGKLYLKSALFFSGETGEIPDSKLEKVVVSDGSAATVYYREDDGKGEKETRAVVREDSRWTFVLPIPKAILK